MPETLYSRAVIERMFSPEQKKQFDQDYEEHKHSKYRNTSVTDTDLMILHDYRKGAMERELAHKYGKSMQSIRTSVRLAALHKLDAAQVDHR